MEIASKAFIFYHSFCLGDAGAQIQWVETFPDGQLSLA